MNKALLMFLLFTTCVTAQKIDRETYYQYNDSIEFRITSIQKNKIVSRGNVNYIAENGRRFIGMTFQYKNNSSSTQVINFNEIYIRDKNGKLQDIDFVVMGMKITFRTDNYQHKLKAHKKKIISVEFTASFDKDEPIDELVIGEKVIALKYN